MDDRRPPLQDHWDADRRDAARLHCRSLLRAIEDRWGLTPIGHSADADVPRFPAGILGKP